MFTLSNLHLLTPGNSVHLKVSILFRVYFIFTFYGVLRLFNRLTDIFVLLSLNVSLCYSCTRAYIRIRCNALTFRLLLKLLSSEKLGKVEISLCIGLTGKIFSNRVAESVVFGWSRIFLSDSGSPIELRILYIALLGWNPNSCLLKWYKFLLTFSIETENSCCVPRFPLIPSCYKIVDSQASFTLCQEVQVGSRKF